MVSLRGIFVGPQLPSRFQKWDEDCQTTVLCAILETAALPFCEERGRRMLGGWMQLKEDLQYVS